MTCKRWAEPSPPPFWPKAERCPVNSFHARALVLVPQRCHPNSFVRMDTIATLSAFTGSSGARLSIMTQQQQGSRRRHRGWRTTVNLASLC